MSFSDAVSQVDQILALEQQLSYDPTSLAGTTPTSATAAAVDTSSPDSADSSSGATFAAALAAAEAQDDSSELGSADSSDPSTSGTSAATELLSGGDSQLLTALSSLGSSSSDDASSTSSDSGVSGGTATSSSDPRIQAMTEEANALVGQRYVYGGGHDGWGPQSGYDCSGFVSAVLHAGGYLSTPQDTTTLPSAPGMASGPGQYVTIYDRDDPGRQGHVIIDIDGQFYESGGEHGSWGGGGGVQEISTPSASYLASFDRVLHPEGL
jgi:cell wall-associated NlpC family hydrolase